MGIRPKLRPKDEEFDKIKAAANSGGGGDKPASGGKGGGKSVNPMAKKGSADYKTMQKANAPDSFYGYYDQNTGDYVPWYIDMINGGGANQAGPQFEGGFGTARLAGGLLNAAGVSPYGQDRPRAFMPFEAYRGGDTELAPFDYRGGSVAAPAPTGVIDAAGGSRLTNGGSTSSPNLMNIPNSMTDDDMGLPTGPVPPTSPQPMSSFLTRYPSRISPNEYDLVYNDPIAPKSQRGAQGGDAELARLRLARQEAIGNRPVPPLGIDPAMMGEVNTSIDLLRTNQPNLPSPATFTATPPSMAGMTPEMGNVENVRFGPRAERAEPISLLDTRQQVPQPNEARALQAIIDNNMMPDFINLPPYQQRAMITSMLERGY